MRFPILLRNPKPICPKLPGLLPAARHLKSDPWEEDASISQVSELAVCGAMVIVTFVQALDELSKPSRKSLATPLQTGFRRHEKRGNCAIATGTGADGQDQAPNRISGGLSNVDLALN